MLRLTSSYTCATMCAICGIIYLQPGQDTSKANSQTEEALTKCRHRGPDHSAVVSLQAAVLGHNRLSIVDLSMAACQPMCDATGTHHIILNGEIFNHNELRSELHAMGITFTSVSDTEVLLQMLAMFGREALQRLNGFFAFAYHNSNTGYTLLACDRFGEKPLHYFQNDSRLCFASELNALMRYDVPAEIDCTSLSLLLQFSYIPSPWNILRGVKRLAPGWCAEITGNPLELRKVEHLQWYIPPVQVAYDTHTKLHKTFEALLEQAVECRLQADVPLGCLLSGGADSSVIALLAKRHNPQLQTFSVGFTDTPFLDETRYAREVANHIGAKHTAIELPSSSFADAFINMMETQDEPFADPSQIALWLLCREARRHIKVALSGDGADELLGGYHKHKAFLRTMQQGTLNRLLPGIGPVISVLPGGRQHAFSNRIRQLMRYNKALEKTFKERYIYLSSFAEGSYHEDLLQQLNIAEKGLRLNGYVSDLDKHDLNTMLLAEQQLVLAGDMLPKVDKAGMAHALEIRPPFLDHRVVEFLNSLPLSQKVNIKQGKILLRETFSAQLPHNVFARKKKGFEIPLEKMLRGSLRPLVQETLGENRMNQQSHLKPEVVKEVLTDFYTYNRSTHTSLIYSLLVFRMWLQRHINE
ncbi:MAG: asparagine synthase (glutamine-hydrolyzing) [Flavobacteriales bacterium]